MSNLLFTFPKGYREELPPFQSYWDEMFNKKQMSVMDWRSGSKVMQLAEVKKSLFKPSRKTDKQAKKRLLILAPIATRTIVKGINDPKKATYKYTKASKSKHSWAHCPEQTKIDLLVCKATNDEAESTLEEFVQAIQKNRQASKEASTTFGINFHKNHSEGN